ncbi:CHAT domain-containing protein [Streptomyces collinus]|uniref:CHAT domain-containing protein n=1 Tax=Streptomyces collinus TaxID=42684 RepID=UPI0036958988
MLTKPSVAALSAASTSANSRAACVASAPQAARSRANGVDGSMPSSPSSSCNSSKWAHTYASPAASLPDNPTLPVPCRSMVPSNHLRRRAIATKTLPPPSLSRTTRPRETGIPVKRVEEPAEGLQNDDSVGPVGLVLHHIQAYFGTNDPRIALAAAPLCAAGSLIHEISERLYEDSVTEDDVELARLVGVLLDIRLQALGEEQTPFDYHAWLSVFGLLHAIAPKVVPKSLAEAFADAPPPVPEPHTLLSAIGMVLLQECGRTKDPEVSGTAIPLLEAALETAPEEEQPAIRCNLGSSWRELAEVLGEPDGLKVAAHHMDQAASAAEGNPERSRMWDSLATVQDALFDHNHDIADLDKAIGARRAMVSEILPETGWWFQLGVLLWKRYQHTRVERYLNEAIDAAARETRIMPSEHPVLPGVLGSLGNMLLARYAATGDLDDLEAALAATAAGERLAPPEHPQRAALRQNTHALGQRYALALSGQPQPAYTGLDLVEPPEPDVLVTLAASLLSQFIRLGDSEDAEAALRLSREALAALPGHAAALSAKSAALFHRFRLMAEPADLAEAFDSASAALAATPDDAPARVDRLAGLAFILRLRFETVGNLEDLTAAIDAAEAAVSLADRLGVTVNTASTALSGLLLARFITLRHRGDIDRAIAAARKAVDTASPGGETGAALTHLAAALHSRYHAFEQREDLDSAITALRTATAATPSTHVDYPIMRLKLAVALRDGDDRDDLDASAVILRQTVRELASRSPGDPNLAHLQSELGLTLMRRWFEGSGPAEDVYDALASFRASSASVTAPTRTRLFSAFYSGKLGILTGDTRGALADYRTAIEHLLPRLADRGIPRASRLAQIAQLPLLASDAAAAAIAADDLRGAVRLLEQGRAVIWSQLMQTRADRNTLRAEHPLLAGEFEAICADLEGSWPGPDGNHTGVPGNGSRRWGLSEQFDDILARIRSLPGFADFIEPPSFELLHRAADDGPVAIINVSSHRCDALLLTSTPGEDPIRLVRLPRVTAKDIELSAAGFLDAISRLNKPGLALGPIEADALGTRITDTLHRLWEDIAEPVLTELDLDQPGAVVPRMWWCPTGPLALLPLHAAGPRNGPRVIDRVISSYTPTLGSLVRARSRRPSRRPQLLVVGVADVPKNDETTTPLTDLPGVRSELSVLGELFGDGHTLRAEKQAVLPAVLSALPSHPWVHFACHGMHDPDDPANSHLVLYDGPLSVTSIAEQDLSGAELAFLSACHTARGTSALADEAIHLAAAFQLAGFQHVVGTLWSLADGPAPQITREFYQALKTSDQGTGGSARALHDAVQRLRQDPRHASRLNWACYVHVGP